MRISLSVLRLLLPILLVLLTATAHAFVHTPKPAEPHYPNISMKEFAESSNKDLERLLGKKLSWKERLTYSILKKKLKREIKENPAFGEVPLGQYLFAPCAKIRLFNGEIVDAEIVEITELKVVYRKCGRSSSPEIEIYKSDVFSIETADGKVIYQDNGEAGATYDDTAHPPLKNDPMAVWALVLTIAGLLFAPLLIVGGILGAISVGRIRRNPDKYKGRGMAMAAAITGLVVVGLAVLLLLILAASFGLGEG